MVVRLEVERVGREKREEGRKEEEMGVRKEEEVGGRQLISGLVLCLVFILFL